jgi:4-hydroxy-2-oxoglutarate aldolase
MLLEGIYAAVTTCFYPDGRPYWRKLEHNIDHYSRGPMSGMVLLGSTGEAVMLSDEESREALRVARDASAADKVLIAGVGRESVFETLRLADYAAQLQYDARPGDADLLPGGRRSIPVACAALQCAALHGL